VATAFAVRRKKYPADLRTNATHAGAARCRTMLRWLTAGESRGRALLAVCEGVPAGVEPFAGADGVRVP
jgi:hypothetical protein